MNSKFKKKYMIFGVVLFLKLVSHSLPEEKTIRLGVEESIIKALDQNINVIIESLNPELSRISLIHSGEKFYPELTFELSKRNTESASYSFLDSADWVITETLAYSGEVNQLLPTGGRLTISLSNDKIDTNRNFQTINPRFGSTIRFNFTQPLLKNFGFFANRKDIIVSRNNLEISEIRFKSIVLDTIFNTENAYWNLVYSIENLKVREQSLKLARELLAKNRRSVEIGRIAKIEIKSAEAEVATREADIFQAKDQVKASEDQLKLILNLNEELSDEHVRILPIDRPIILDKSISFTEAIDLAMNNRPDLQEKRIDLKTKKTELRFAKNQLLPDLNLQAAYWSPGISGTKIFYQDNNALTGIVVDTIPGDASQAMDNAFKFMYPNWSLILNLKVPLSTLISRTELASARVTLKQTQLRLLNNTQQVMVEIKDAVRAVQTNFLRIKAYRIARELTQQKLHAEEEKLNVGKTTNYNVFLFQRDLATAQSNELKAIIEYNLSLANLHRALGISLKERNIKIKDFK